MDIICPIISAYSPPFLYWKITICSSLSKIFLPTFPTLFTRHKIFCTNIYRLQNHPLQFQLSILIWHVCQNILLYCHGHSIVDYEMKLKENIYIFTYIDVRDNFVSIFLDNIRFIKITTIKVVLVYNLNQRRDPHL